MIGIVLVTHGELATEFRSVLEHVVGPQEQVETIAIGAEDDMEKRRDDILNSVGKVNDGNGVIILTDMFGGTPSNIAISIMQEGKIEVIAGINLPMLVKLAKARTKNDMAYALEQAQEAGKKYINVASTVLQGQ
ncbi:MAG: PTS sugar transporter subunit IIA [Nitratireductor sp.]